MQPRLSDRQMGQFVDIHSILNLKSGIVTSDDVHSLGNTPLESNTSRRDVTECVQQNKQKKAQKYTRTRHSETLQITACPLYNNSDRQQSAHMSNEPIISTHTDDVPMTCNPSYNRVALRSTGTSSPQVCVNMHTMPAGRVSKALIDDIHMVRNPSYKAVELPDDDSDSDEYEYVS